MTTPISIGRKDRLQLVRGIQIYNTLRNGRQRDEHDRMGYTVDHLGYPRYSKRNTLYKRQEPHQGIFQGTLDTNDIATVILPFQYAPYCLLSTRRRMHHAMAVCHSLAVAPHCSMLAYHASQHRKPRITQGCPNDVGLCD